MTIASEIVKAAEERHGNARYGDIDTITASAEEWEVVIDAKLEPLRIAIQGGVDSANIHYCTCAYCEGLRAAIAMFEEADDARTT